MKLLDGVKNMFRKKQGFGVLMGVWSTVMILSMCALVGGAAILMLDKFSIAAGGGSDAGTAINASRDAIGEIFTTWYSILILIAVMTIIIILLVNAFKQGFGGAGGAR